MLSKPNLYVKIFLDSDDSGYICAYRFFNAKKKGETSMSEELQSMVQIIELYGRGLEALGRAIRFSAKGAAKGVDVAKIITMQCRMKLHYASTGNRKTMKLSDLEKLTGGQYNILNNKRVHSHMH